MASDNNDRFDTDIESRINDLTPDEHIHLFKVTPKGRNPIIVRFTSNSIAKSGGLVSNLYYGGITPEHQYIPFPSSVFGLVKDSENPNTPKLRLSNINNVSGFYAVNNKDLIRAKVEYRITFREFILTEDGVSLYNSNITTKTALEARIDELLAIDQNDQQYLNWKRDLDNLGDTFTSDELQDFVITINRSLPTETLFISKKSEHNSSFIEFELESATALNNLEVPAKLFKTYCSRAYGGRDPDDPTSFLYREGLDACPYGEGDYKELARGRYFDKNNAPTNDPSKDCCAKNPKACELRFGEGNLLPGRFCPGLNRRGSRVG